MDFLSLNLILRRFSQDYKITYIKQKLNSPLQFIQTLTALGKQTRVFVAIKEKPLTKLCKEN